MEFVVGTSSVPVSWNTNLLAYSILSWGETLDYELGSMAEFVPATPHLFTIEDLSPGTPYFFKIAAYEAGNPDNSTSSLGHSFDTEGFATDETPANPANFTAVYDVSESAVLLSWENPSDPDFSVVRIVRSTTFFIDDPEDGEVIYEGSGEFFEDSGVAEGVTYYYTIFTRDDGGNYSSGAIASETIPGEDILPEPDDELDEEPDEETELPVTVPDIFDSLPIAKDLPPELQNLTFIFKQGDTEKEFAEGSRISLGGTESTTLYISYDNLPEVLKTIAVTMRHPRDKDKIFSFLLRVDEEKSRYEATIGPLLDAGEYSVNIYVLDHSRAKLAEVRGAVFVDKGAAPLSGFADAEDYLPVGSAIGLISGLTQIIVVSTNVSSAYDLYLLIMRFFGAILGFLGLRRKHKPWGTVYDSVTKRPLDPAYVVVKQDGKDIADAITDLDGRYGFLLPSGKYTIEAGKTHYSFPSKALARHDSDELYGNLYHGEQLLTASGEVITRNIPLDPEGFDWNEFVKSKQKLYRLYSRREKIKSIIFDVLYIVGFVFTLLATLLSPGTFNFVVLSLYIIIFLVQTYWRSSWRAVMIKDAESGEPYSFAIVRIFMSNLNQEVKRVVADEFGRFYMLVSPGDYYITIDAKQADGSYRRVHRSEELNLPKGVLSGDIIIGNSSQELKMQTAK